MLIKLNQGRKKFEMNLSYNDYKHSYIHENTYVCVYPYRQSYIPATYVIRYHFGRFWFIHPPNTITTTKRLLSSKNVHKHLLQLVHKILNYQQPTHTHRVSKRGISLPGKQILNVFGFLWVLLECQTCRRAILTIFMQTCMCVWVMILYIQIYTLV